MQQGLPVVSPDSIRLALHGKPFLETAEPWVRLLAKLMVKALFLSGHSTVILDCTNHTRKRRDEWISKRWRRQFHVLDADVHECLKRAEKTPGPNGYDTITAVIRRMAGEFEQVGYDEQ
jgi:hypothetical protein